MNLSPVIRQIFRFMGAGGIGVILYYIVLTVLTELCSVPYLVSAGIASLVNLTSNYILHKSWTFSNAGTKKARSQAWMYAILYGSVVVLNLALLYVLVHYIHLWYLGAQVLVSIVLTAASYPVSRKIFAQ